MPRARSRSLEEFALLALCLALGAVAVTTLTPGIVGLFHDDGLYVASAKALAERGEYRLLSLPGQPIQTKYPPLYPALLAVLWRAMPRFPDNVLWLKAMNCGFVAAALYAVSRVAKASVPESVFARFAVVILLGTSPGILGFCDFTLTDIPFLALTTSTLWASAYEGSRERWASEFGIAALTAATLLTRSIGVGLAMAVVVERLLRGRWRAALLHSATSGLVALGWTGWASLRRSPDAGPLLQYYLSYEKSALAYLGADPHLAWNIVSGNLSLIRDSAGFVIGPAWHLVAPVSLVLALLGVYRLARRGVWLPLLFAGVTLPAVLVHPFAPHRYLIPLLPVFIIAVVAGAATAREQFVRALESPAVIILVVAGPLVVGNHAWWRQRATPSTEEHLVGCYGTDLGYRWAGFEETFQWVRANTPVDARLGSLFDPMYFLYTGRPSVRPWIHHSETYFYPYGKARPFVGAAAEVARELARLRVDYLILDPPKGFAEGEAAMAMLRELLALPEVNGSLEFRSSDGEHEVYRVFHTGGAS
jgi:hypothetical protein